MIEKSINTSIDGKDEISQNKARFLQDRGDESH